MTAKKIFLSYARIDIQRATALYEELKHANLQVWFDQVELKPGMRWEPAIRKAIQEADYFIALLSRESCSSRGFRHKELRRAIEIMQELPDDKIYVIPVRLDDCEPPVGGLSELHRVDLLPSWENGIGQICSTLDVKVKKKRNKTATDIKRPLIEDLWGRFSSLQGKERATALTSGFRDLDELTSGFRNSELFVIGARPSMGKTAFVCNTALSMAKCNHKVLIISLNETNLNLTERLLCILARIDNHKVRHGNLDDFERIALMEASNELSKAPLFIDDVSSRTIEQIDKAIRGHVRENSVGCVIIDYLQLIEVQERNQTREQQLSNITRRLKQQAKDLKIPVIVVSHLNSIVEQRENKRPRLSDLREFGTIEQDADVIMFLHRPEAYNPEDEPGVAYAIIAKNRSGPIDSVKLTWVRESLRFADYSPMAAPGGDW